MQTYKSFSPTAFDSNIDIDRADWLVVPVSQTRDSGCLDQSNFQQAIEMLGGESDDVEVHRFGHWGPGWFEIIIVRPDSAAASIAEDIESSLENYPVLNEEDFSNREWEAYLESWESWGCKEFLETLEDFFHDTDCAAFQFLESMPVDHLRELYESGITNGCYYECHSDGVSICTEYCDLSRSDVAAFIQAKRIARNPRIAWRDPAQGTLFDMCGA